MITIFFSPIGPAKHCTNYTIETQNKPTTAKEIFQIKNSPFENCGDLLFSGHMLSARLIFYAIKQFLEPLDSNKMFSLFNPNLVQFQMRPKMPKFCVLVFLSMSLAC